tara:strand:- start:5895 stop:6251 length:357 start_codon:yes stop_codon:yes gene_type:complete
MELIKEFIESPLYFECPVSGEVIIDEENEISNNPSSATEFIFYDGEFEFQKQWVSKSYENSRLFTHAEDLPLKITSSEAFIHFIKSESLDSKNVVCYHLIMGTGPSLERLFVGIKIKS